MEDKMKQFILGEEPHLETENQATGMLKELSLKWFMETQAPLMLQNGTLPEWFHGFITRKQTEALLEDKAVGCFIVRLSDRTVGFILSYRGSDRCRHFVINQLQNRRYIISGDTCSHDTLQELISYYKSSQIEPFGENLTFSCSRPDETDLYDAISLKPSKSARSRKTNAFFSKQVSRDSRPSGSTSEEPNYPRGAPVPKASFLYDKKILENCPGSVTEEENNSSLQGSDRPPPLPERNLSFPSETSGSRSQEKIIYAELKKVNQKSKGLSLETPGGGDRAAVKDPFRGDPLQKPEDAGKAQHTQSPKPLTWTKHPEGSSPERSDTLTQTSWDGLCSAINPESHRKQVPFPRSPNLPRAPAFSSLNSPEAKEKLRSSPTPTSSKASPKRGSRPRVPLEPQDGEQTRASSTAVLRNISRWSKASEPSSPGTVTQGAGYEEFGKGAAPDPHQPGAKDASGTQKPVPGIWPKQDSRDRVSERSPKSPLFTASTAGSQGSGEESQPDDTYEKIPGHLSEGPAAKPVPEDGNTYDCIYFRKGTETKRNQKADKYRRFFFADRKK